MVRFIKENGKTINIMGMEFMNFQTVPFTKGNGKIIYCMEVDFLLTQMVKNGKDNFVKEFSKVGSKFSCLKKREY